MDSDVRYIGATVDSRVVNATELPINKICGLHASEMSDVTPSSENTCLYTSPVIDEVPLWTGGSPFWDKFQRIHLSVYLTSY